MKKILIALIAVMFVFVACENNNSILEPNTTSSIKPNVLLTNENPLYEIMSIALEDTTFIQLKYSKKLTVDGNKGGKIKLEYKYKSKENKLVKLDAVLTIPKNAYKGELTFDMIFDLENYGLKFEPHPFTFDIPVILDLKFSNIDLSGFDLNNFVFDYLDGESEHLPYDKIKYDLEKGDLEILGAQIPHFSRYGWTRVK
ncbi:MAG: hypothetical protein H6609_16120 [Ignavibacteriales bacterium]|nr:hypothetical protein [Ignavibacteriales bacterium]